MQRVRASTVADRTSLSVRAVQAMAAKGKIPGAAKLGRIWTFDPKAVDDWIIAAQREDERCRKTSTSADARGGYERLLEVESYADLYRQATKPRRESGRQGY